MIAYNLNSKINYGKQVYALEDLLKSHPDYLDWCIIKLSWFTVTDETMDEIKKIIPDIKVSEKAEEMRQQKCQIYEADPEFETEDFSESKEDNNDEMDCPVENDIDEWLPDLNPAHDPSQNPWISVFGRGDEADAAFWSTE